MTLINFQPNNAISPPFSASVVMDGSNYNLSVKWSLYAQRWYMFITDQYGNNAWTGAMVGSPLEQNIYLAAGVFTVSTIIWREDTGYIEITP